MAGRRLGTRTLQRRGCRNGQRRPKPVPSFLIVTLRCYRFRLLPLGEEQAGLLRGPHRDTTTSERPAWCALLALIPSSATVLTAGGTTRTVPVERLVPGDMLRLVAGERLATDGIVRSGDSSLDVSAITGESIPVEVSRRHRHRHGSHGLGRGGRIGGRGFTCDDLRLIPRTVDHARRGRRIINQNIVLSLAIITVLLPLAITGVLGLAAVVLVHEIAEIIVVLNGLRAARRSRQTTVDRSMGSRACPINGVATQ